MGIFKEIENGNTQNGVFSQAAQRAEVSHGGIPLSTSSKPFGDSPVGQVGNALSNMGVGIGTTIGKTGLGLGQAAVKGVGFLAGTAGAKNVEKALGDVATGIGDISKAVYQDPFKKETDTFAGKTGQVIGDVATFLAPAARAAQAEKTIDILSKGISSPAIAAASRVTGKGIVQGLAAGATTLAQTGGNVKEALKSAALAGGVRSGFAVVGEGARAFKLPERLYSQVFKNSSKDMIQELREGGLQRLQQTNPDKYKEFVKKGLIKVGGDGAPIVNETLAEQAVKKGLSGSIRNMADEVVNKTVESEDKVRNIVKTYEGTVSLKEPQFENVLRKISQEWEDVGFGEISDEANKLADVLKSTKGDVPAETALNIRRFLDRVRVSSSFDKPATSLSMTQSNLKTLGDSVRQRLNAIPGMGDTMKDYAFYIEALEALAKEAARTGNRQVVSLIDSIFLGAGIGAGDAVTGGAAALVRRFLTTPQYATQIGSALQKGTASAPTIAGIGEVSNVSRSLTSGQRE